MITTLVRSLLVGTLAVVLLNTSPARACTGTACIEGAILPEALRSVPGFELEAQRPGQAPENLVAIIWRKPFAFVGKVSKEPPRLFVREGQQMRELTFSISEIPSNSHPLDAPQLFVIEPDEAPSSGSELVFEWREGCLYPDSTVDDTRTESRTVRVEPAAPVPRKLGRLTAEVAGGRVDVGCLEYADAMIADLKLELSPEAEPYADLLRFELLVDGKPEDFFDDGSEPDAPRPIGGGVLGRGHDRVADLCKRDSGEHSVQLRAALPDGTSLETPEVNVDLSCGSGCSLTPAAVGGRPNWLATLWVVGLLLRLARKR